MSTFEKYTGYETFTKNLFGGAQASLTSLAESSAARMEMTLVDMLRERRSFADKERILDALWRIREDARQMAEEAKGDQCVAGRIG